MNKDILKKVSIGIGIAGLALFPLFALAQFGVEPQQTPLLTTPSGIRTILFNILNFFALIVFVIAVIMLLYAAILYLGAGASTTALEKAKSVLIYAIVGIVVALLAYSVRPFIQNIIQGNM